MADNTSVGSVSISLDIDVSSNLEKQISKVSDNIANTIKSNIEKSTSKSDLSKSIGKSLSLATRKSKDIGTKIGKNIAEGIKKATSKISATPEKIAKKTPSQTTKSSRSSSGNIDREMLVSKRDNDLQLLDNLNNQIEVMQGKLSQMTQYNPAKSMSEDYLKLEARMLSTIAKSDRLSGSIRKMNKAIDDYDTNQASSSTENLTKSQTRLQSVLSKVTSLFNRNKRASESLGASNKRTSNSIIDVSKSASNARKPLVNFGSFGRSLVRQFLGLSLAIRLVGQGVRKMAQSFWASLRANTQFSSSLTQIKSNLSTAFQPIYQAILPAINALMSALSKATAYLAAFISMIFGKSVKASNASAKALAKAKDGMDAYGASAKDAQRITAGFDQLNDITEDNSGGGSGGTGTVINPVNIDEAELTGLEKFMSKAKDIIDKAFDSKPVKAFTGYVQTYYTQMSASISRISGAIATNVVSTWHSMLPNIKIGLDNIFNLWTNIFNDLSDYTTNWFPKMTDQIVDFIDNVFGTFRPAFELLSKMWSDFSGILLELWNTYGKRILDGIGEFITGAMDTFNKIWTNIIDPIISPALAFLREVWDKQLKGIIFQIGDFVGNAIARALELYNKFIKPVIDWLVVNLGPTFSKIFDHIGGAVGGVLSSMLKTVSSVIGSIKGIFNGLFDLLEGLFSGDWKKIMSGFSTIFKNAVDGLKAIFKAPINWIIDGINGFVKGLNKIKVPSWVPGVGGKGINLDTIPKLASGGVLKQPTLNIAGEYPGARSNPEIVTPQNIMRDTFRDVMSEFMNAFANGFGMGGVAEGTINLVVNIGGMKLLDMIIDLAKEYTKQTGKQVIINA